MKALEFEPDEALRRLSRGGDPFAPLLTLEQHLPEEFVATFQRITPQRKRQKKPDQDEDRGGALVNGIRLPRRGSQSGRRLFVLPRTETGSSPSTRPTFAARCKRSIDDRVSIEDVGGYERIDGSFDHERVSLYFTGKVLEGEWMMEKIRKRSRHRSWALTPVAT